MATRMGTPSNRPYTPQSQPLASTPTKMATGFIWLARLVSQGVSRKASRPWITSDASLTNSAIFSVLNCRKLTSAEPTAMAMLIRALGGGWDASGKASWEPAPQHLAVVP